MFDKSWEKYGALGVIWFVVLNFVGALLGGSPPSRTDSAAEIARYYADNDTAIQFGGFLIAIGVIGLVVWFGSLWRAMDRAEGGSPYLAIIALSGFIVSGTMALAAWAINAAMAAGIADAGERSADFYEIVSVLFGFSSIGDVIMISAVSALVWSTGFLPKWIAQLGVIVVLCSLVSAVGIASDASFFELFAFIAILIWVVWIVSVGVLLYRKTPAGV